MKINTMSFDGTILKLEADLSDFLAAPYDAHIDEVSVRFAPCEEASGVPGEPLGEIRLSFYGSADVEGA